MITKRSECFEKKREKGGQARGCLFGAVVVAFSFSVRESTYHDDTDKRKVVQQGAAHSSHMQERD